MYRRSLLAAWLISLGVVPTAAPLELPDHALVMPGAGVQPNVIVTLDNSVVGHHASSDGLDHAASARRYHFSAAYNTLYYDPRQRYAPPPGYPNQPFTAAKKYFDGTATVNLQTAYLATLRFGLTGLVPEVAMWHPRCDSTDKVSGACNASVECGPGTDPCKFGLRDSPSHAYYYLRDISLPYCDASDLKDEDCYKYVKVGSPEDLSAGGFSSPEEARTNFANWYTYYRTLQLRFISAMLRTFPIMEGKVRLAWQAHGQPQDPSFSCVGFGNEIPADTDWHRTCQITKDGVTKTYDTRLAPFAGSHRNQFYDWLVTIPYAPAPANTARAAMVRAAEYFMRDNAYRDDPRNPTSPMRSCRANYHIMFNGPNWSNNDQDVSGRGLASRVARYPCTGRHLDMCSALPPAPASERLPSPSGWLPRAPYRMNPSNNAKTGWDENGGVDQITASQTLGSLALYYWATDLKPDLANNVPAYLADETGDFETRFWNPKNDPATWQHMVNFMVVNASPASLGTDWVGDMYGGPIVADKTKGWPYVSTISGLTPRAFVYDFWRGALNSRGLFLLAMDIDQAVNTLTARLDAILARATSASSLASSISTTQAIAGTHVYKAAFVATDASGSLSAHRLDDSGKPAKTPDWEATIPASGRRLMTWNGSAGAAFDYANFSAAQKAAFDAAAGTFDKAEVMAWLKGDRSKEGKGLRRRASLLGDIVNADPVFVGDEFYPLLARLRGEGASYREYVSSKKDRVKMVYVGANDGMLHGFVAGAGAGGDVCGAASLGQEVLAYVPGAVVGRLPYLAKPDYTHRFYVDGPLYAGDAYLDLGDGAKWRTILLGGLGNGGRAVFALDVTNPCAFDANKVLWEFSSANDADLGYTHARPLMAKLNNGQWAAVVANGYNSANGHAVLFLLDLKTGAVIRKIDADAGAGGLDNGLMSPTLYDANGDGIIDHVYAGDNLGRLWKFDLSSSNPAEWKVAYAGQPLFTTGGEPIQAAPQLGDPPAGTNGVMVYFGSGRLVTSADVTDMAGRAFYAVLDSGVANLSRADLRAQTVTSTEVVAGRTLRKSTHAPIDYATHKGWYIALSAGERVISPAQFVAGRILFTSASPTADPCGAGGESWLYELDPFSGAMPAASIFDFGTTAPLRLAALKLGGLSKSTIILRDNDTGWGTVLALDAATRVDSQGFRVQGVRLGRVSWREVLE